MEVLLKYRVVHQVSTLTLGLMDPRINGRVELSNREIKRNMEKMV